MSETERDRATTTEAIEAPDMPETTIWLAYDFGVRGDYDGIYSWLDKHNAKECGPSLAVLTYKYSPTIVSDIRKDIKKNVNIWDRDRVYLIYREREGKKANKGIFLFGGRKGPPWSGYAISSSEDSDEEIL